MESELSDSLAGNALADYELAYRYVGDRLLVFNHANYNPNELPPIVGRVEPDGSIVILDEGLPQHGRLEIRRVAETELDRYKAEAEARAQSMLEYAASVAEADRSSHPNATAPDTTASNVSNSEPGSGFFRITEETQLGSGGIITKYHTNLKAIELLKELEASGRSPTSQERHQLARYAGWGSMPQAFDERNAAWQDNRERLQNALTREEYAAARASVTNAHYTSDTIVNAIYEGVRRLGFAGGAVLEPSMGTGNFFGLMPDDLRGNSHLTGVELDSITGRIARQLYPEAAIHIQGFEHTPIPDNAVDLIVGNVPFGSYKLADHRYDKYNFYIHDYFLAKGLDTLRPGGLMAVVVTNGVLDRQNNATRLYLAERAELVGAIRLPNNAFERNAHTSVTTDILFLQKLERQRAEIPSWVHLGQTQNGVPVNEYYVQHPEMVMGRMAFHKNMYGSEKDTACLPEEGMSLADRLRDAIAMLGEGIYVQSAAILDEEAERALDVPTAIPADPSIKNYTYTLVDDTIYYREGHTMTVPAMSAVAAERVRGMIGIRACVREVIDAQIGREDEAHFQDALARLNRAYDTFSEKFGPLGHTANRRAFGLDADYPLLASLENTDREGDVTKADFFIKRTIRPIQQVLHTDTSSEALIHSMNERGRVDIPYMARLTGKTEKETIEDLRGQVYHNPQSQQWEDANEYLSGNVREKLRIAENAATDDPTYLPNAEALRESLPELVPASDIEVRLGAAWVPQDVIKDFVVDLMRLDWRDANRLQLHYSPETTVWAIPAAGRRSDTVAASREWGTSRMSAYDIMESTLNLKTVRVMDRQEDGSYKYNPSESIAAVEKQKLMKERFKEWVFADPARQERLVELYNEQFNFLRLRSYDGSSLTFPGMSPDITLKPHQRDAVARILYGGNTLLAHVVGAGKTFEITAAAMEMKRLGLAQKPMIVVPNHLVEQWGHAFLQLYPSANVLLATRNDFASDKRKRFCSRIATGDYDAVIIGHSSFGKIPLSQERREALLQDQIDELIAGIREIKDADGDNWTVKQMEAMRKGLETELTKLQAAHRKDNVINFEELGVDALFVDEAHGFKNLFFTTKMNRVAGLSTSRAQKSTDMFGKIQYIQEQTPGRNVIFATGTPISNSMVEMYTMQRYLQMELLRERSLHHFDNWASTFGESVTALELNPTGTGHRLKERFARFYNLPELLSMFRLTADVQTQDMLKLPIPDLQNDKPHVDVTTPSAELRSYIQTLAHRAEVLKSTYVDPKIDNMLLVTTDGRKAALDMRLVDPVASDYPDSKLNHAVENIHAIWERHRDQRLTQLVFSDLGTPGGEGFCVYDDIREKLIARGIPEGEIAFIHSASTDAAKEKLFADVREGNVRILMGSTQKMGAGTNCQDKLIALHHLDVPWKPADIEQREGRILRQGNQNPEVVIFRYVTENSFDAYSWQLIEQKQRFISQVMTGRASARSASDVDEAALSYAEVKALASGNPAIREKIEVETELSRLQVLKASHIRQVENLRHNISTQIPRYIAYREERRANAEQNAAIRDAHPQMDKDNFTMVVTGRVYTEKAEAGERLLAAVAAASRDGKDMEIGTYRGFSILAGNMITLSANPYLHLAGAGSIRVDLGISDIGNITRLDNALAGLEEDIAVYRKEIDDAHTQLTEARRIVDEPFPHKAEMEVLAARLKNLDMQLGLDKPDEVMVGYDAATAVETRVTEEFQEWEESQIA